MSGDELSARLLDGSLRLAVVVERIDEDSLGISFEELRRYRSAWQWHPPIPSTAGKSVSVAEAVAEPIVGIRRRDFSGYCRTLDNLFGPHKLRLNVAVECDSASSLITEVEIGKGIAVVTNILRLVSG